MTDSREDRPDGSTSTTDAPVQTDHLLEEFESEKPARRLTGFPKRFLSVAGFLLSLYALYWVLDPLPEQLYRTSFLAVALAMTFVLYRAWGSGGRGEGGRSARTTRG